MLHPMMTTIFSVLPLMQKFKVNGKKEKEEQRQILCTAGPYLSQRWAVTERPSVHT